MATFLRLRDHDFDIPAVTLGQLRRGMLEKIKRSDEMAATSWMDSVLLRGEIIIQAFQEKYPDEKFTEDEILDSMEVAGFADVFNQLLFKSGIKNPEGEATAAKTVAGT